MRRAGCQGCCTGPPRCTMAGWDNSRPRPSTPPTRPVSQQASRQAVPAAKVIWIRKDGDPRELLLVAYVQTAGGAVHDGPLALPPVHRGR